MSLTDVMEMRYCMIKCSFCYVHQLHNDTLHTSALQIYQATFLPNFIEMGQNLDLRSTDRVFKSYSGQSCVTTEIPFSIAELPTAYLFT